MDVDNRWKPYFEDNNRYADLINGIGCNGEQLLKASDLQEVDPTEKKKSRDLLRRVALGMNFLIIGIENQQKVDYKFPLRNMQYDVSRYQKQASVIEKKVRENAKKVSAAEYLSRFGKADKLNPVITIALYAGKEEWDGPRCLHDMIDFSNVPKGLKNMVSNYKINIVDICRMTDTSMFKTDLRQVFDFIRFAEDKEKLLELIESDTYFSHMKCDALEVINAYTNIGELSPSEEYQVEEGDVDVCKAIQDLIKDSIEEGRAEGRVEGREEGRMLSRIENAKSLLDILTDEIISERIQLPLATVQALRAEQAKS